MRGDSADRNPKVAVVGFPNAGKSTLVNRLVGGGLAVTDSQPGVTRDRRSLPCIWNGLEFDLIDTGGMDSSDTHELSAQVRRQAQQAIAEADLVLAVVDARAGAGPGEVELAGILRGSEAPVLLVGNKVDKPADEHLLGELHGLGLGEPMAVSAAHGMGTGDLLDQVVERLKEQGASLQSPQVTEERPPRIAVIGRPNVGKSSLVNALLGADRVIVSEQAGTTRDPIDTELDFGNERVVLVDTAGLRRKGKIPENVGYYSQVRSEQAAEEADAAIVVCDASEGITSEDLKVAELAMKTGCATLLLMNKWDITRTDIKDATVKAERKLKMRPPVRACSALTGRGIEKALAAAIELAHRAGERITTSDLNRFIADAVAAHPPPERRGRRLKLLYAAQVERRPPRIAIQVNDRSLINRDWAFYLENQMRDAYDLQGVPLVIDYVPRSGTRKGSKRGRRGAGNGAEA